MKLRNLNPLFMVALLSILPSIVAARTLVVPRCTSPPCSPAADQYSTVDSALAAAASGDRIYIQRGTYVAPSGGWKISKTLEIFGDGAGEPIFTAGASPKATLLKPASSNDPVIVLDPDASSNPTLWNIYIHDLEIAQDTSVPAVANASSNGIYCKITGTKVLGNLRLARVFIYGMGNDGIHLEGKDGTSDPVGVSIEDCNSTFNTRHGLYALYTNVLTVRGGEFGGNYQKGAQVSGCPVAHFIGTTFQSNEKVTTDPLVPSQLFIEGSPGFLVSGCHFEGFANNEGSGVLRALAANSLGGYIGSNVFVDNNSTSGATGVYVGFTSQGIVVGPNNFANVDKLVELADVPEVRSCTVQPQTVVPWSSPSVAAKLVIPEATDRGHVVVPATNSGIFGLTAGIEFPRLSAARRDSMAAPSSGGTRREGLVIYNNDTKRLNYWDGSRWREKVAFFPTTTAANAPPGGINLPAISSTTRDNIPTAFKTAGTLIFNSTTNELNYWNGSAWRAVTNKNP